MVPGPGKWWWRGEPCDLVREANSGYDRPVTKPVTPAVLYNNLETVRLRQGLQGGGLE